MRILLASFIVVFSLGLFVEYPAYIVQKRDKELFELAENEDWKLIASYDGVNINKRSRLYLSNSGFYTWTTYLNYVDRTGGICGNGLEEILPIFNNEIGLYLIEENSLILQPEIIDEHEELKIYNGKIIREITGRLRLRNLTSKKFHFRNNRRTLVKRSFGVETILWRKRSS